ncbi:GNAT family N-acetyltransferase [Streptomyces sp. SID4982]|uniref:GNAT family N-acetyltransferase n=1 Tax=Streptomyces sp. SID4982 TaxID=2690291 RepID=UPI00136CF26A|nr:GNAT family N-acetyltransferase [Streptomyces sp. SID4982]MYS14212.1 GNAT family N-acetyltransferase [Streptomyces sp. SID4982]
MNPVELTTERLLLRPVRPDDTEAVLAAAQDPAIQRWISSFPSPYLREHAETFVSSTAPEGWADDSMYTLGAFLPTGELTGMLSLAMRGPGHGELGYWAAREHRGRGYVTEAASAVARWAFTALSVDRLEWRAEVGNGASRAVAERLGFTVEGVLRAGVGSRGVRRDSWVGSLLPSDLGLRSALPYLPARTQPSEAKAQVGEDCRWHPLSSPS